MNKENTRGTNTHPSSVHKRIPVTAGTPLAHGALSTGQKKQYKTFPPRLLTSTPPFLGVSDYRTNSTPHSSWNLASWTGAPSSREIFPFELFTKSSFGLRSRFRRLANPLCCVFHCFTSRSPLRNLSSGPVSTTGSSIFFVPVVFVALLPILAIDVPIILPDWNRRPPRL